MLNRIGDENEIVKLQNQIAELKAELEKTREALRISARRYEIAVGFSDVTIFDYDIKTKKILMQPADYELFGLQGSFEGGVENIINSGIIVPQSVDDIREFYHKIDEGAPSARTIVQANAVDGSVHMVELQLVTIFDNNNSPAYAVGVRKDLSDVMRIKNEAEYNSLLASEFTFIYEANVTRDKILRFDSGWANEIGLGDVRTLSGVLKLMCSRFVAPDDIDLFYQKQSRNSLLTAFEKGEHIISFEYRKWVEGMCYQWFKVRVNIIEDEIVKDINARVYVQNIDSQKADRQKENIQNRRYELALAKSDIVYEINITKDSMVYVHENLHDDFELYSGEHFAKKVLPLIIDAVHQEDKAKIAALLSYENLIDTYEQGKSQLTCEYRRADKKRIYHWFRSILQLSEDLQTNELLCDVYIENINEEKEKEFELLFKAQHDLMTGLYNKNAVEEKIEEILSLDLSETATHVFFIMDIDHFKRVNDSYGHAFGDSVLEQVAGRVSALFRQGDIIGRIGGDEFVIFMKDVKDEKIASIKAHEICDCVSDILVCDNDADTLSLSVGIAVYPKHGKTYDKLYRHSDVALYNAKELGRNRFSIYGKN